MGKYVVERAKNGFKFDLLAGNNEVIASSETYTTQQSCRNGIESVRKNAPIAPIEDQTVEGYKKISSPKFELYTDKAGECRFRLRAANGEPIATSEGYTSKSGCLNGIESVKKNADSEVVRMDKK